MLKDKTNLKCLGCNGDFPLNTDREAYENTYYAAYDGQNIIEWICRDCWLKGIRYKYNIKK